MTQTPTRRATAKTETNDYVQLSRSKKTASSSTPHTSRFASRKERTWKDGWSDFNLCEYDTGPDDNLTDVEAVQQVRAVWNSEQWELHFVCKVAIDADDQSGEKTAGVDLGICNTAAVSVGDETLLYPGNALKEDAHYFRRKEYDTEGENGPSTRTEWVR